MNDTYMNLAYKEALRAKKNNEIPVGCIIVKKNRIIARGYNKKENEQNCIMHAEMIAINKACKKLKSWRLDDCILYTTLEPCMMCVGAIVESRIKFVYYGSKNNNEQMYDCDKISKFLTMVNLNNVECSKILTEFFKNRRKK